MAITAASIEASGWVLRLTLPASAGSFASYALDPDGTPKINLACVHPGFAPSGGIAVATPLARIIVGTKPLRKPVNPALPDTPVIDETNNGDGTITVRVALSEYVHVTETSLTLSVAAGWRTGEGAASGIAVTNGSTFVAPVPIFRWARLSYQRETGAFDLELVVFSHHPQGFAPAAGVKFTATDGTTVKTFWTTALSTSTTYGDNLRCYRVTVDPATATALTAGLLRCDAEVYPWLGLMRSTDPAGTRSMTGLTTAGYDDTPQRPHVVGYDPAGTRYGAQHLFVDPAGSATPVAGMVQASLASAKALATGSRPANLTTAIQALYLANRSLTAANGGAAASRSTDAAIITLAAGTHVPGTSSVTTGITSSELPIIVQGDPDDPAPRTNCILQTAASAPNARVSKIDYRNLRLEVGGAALLGSATAYCSLDNVELRGKTGFETNTVAVFLGSVAGKLPLNAVRSRWWRSGSGFGGSTQRMGLLRACEFSRGGSAALTVNNRFIPATEDTTATGVIPSIYSLVTGTTGGQEDNIIAGNDLRSVKGRALFLTALAAATAGTPNPSYRRVVFAFNVCERIGTNPEPLLSMGESELCTMSYNIIEGNTIVGDRANLFYSDPIPSTSTEADTLLNQAYGNRLANNVGDWFPTKHDAFNDPETATARGGGSANGYRPQMVEAWSIIYGVGFEGNVDLSRLSENFRYEYFGRRSVQLSPYASPGHLADRSQYGSPTTGGGLYSLTASSTVLFNRVLRGNSDRDFANASRRTSGSASGAYAASDESGAALSADGGVLPLVGSIAGLAAAAALAPGAATLPLAGVAATLLGAASLGAVAGVLPLAGTVASIAGAARLAAAAGQLPLIGSTAVLTIGAGGVTLAAAASTLPLAGSPAALAAAASLAVDGGKVILEGSSPEFEGAAVLVLLAGSMPLVGSVAVLAGPPGAPLPPTSRLFVFPAN